MSFYEDSNRQFLEDMNLDALIFHSGYDENGLYIGEMTDDENDLEHYGTPRHSGRYPWGSGDNPYQRNESFLGAIEKMKKAVGPDGKKLYKNETEIAKAMGMNSSELRNRKAAALAENRAYLVSEVKRLKAKGMSTSAIGRRIGRNESSVRLMLNEQVNDRMNKTLRNATLLKERVNDKNFIDIGKGEERYLGMSATALGHTIHLLEQDGYVVHNVDIKQQTTGKNTTVRVLCKPGTTKKEAYEAAKSGDIHLVNDLISKDGGSELTNVRDYVSVDPKRVMINYAETGGKDKDGVIELRRGVDDLSLGRNNYAQVRILVDDTHYLKGMAVYADDLPPGVDIRFNTNKHSDVPMINKENPDQSVLKPIKDKNMENPFGANIKPDNKLTKAQRDYLGADGEMHQSAINIVKEEGDVDEWARRLPSQFLAKQSPELAKQQLKMAYDVSKAQFDEIASYTNPTVKAAMLEDFAGRCDTDSVHLRGAALPRQQNKFILPLTNVRETECYCPTYDDGEQLALIRFPHGNISEIPIVTVNNRNKQAQSIIGDARDAVGINAKAAERLSGADFDGDTVLCIPLSNVKIKNKEQFKELRDFDAKEEYKYYDGMHVMPKGAVGMEMGKISNLITDMTIKGAPDDELAMAIKHSMVVIDANKHKLDYKRSEIDNHIAELKARYQPKDEEFGGGASTFISRSTGPMHIPARELKRFSEMTADEKERWKNGEQIYKNVKPLIIKDPIASQMTKEERVIWRTGSKAEKNALRNQMIKEGRYAETEKVKTMEVAKGSYYDPYQLVSTGDRETTRPIERIYADYAVQMKELAREARKLARSQTDIKYDSEAAKYYADEVKSLKHKVAIAEMNAPLERQAQMKAGVQMRLILQSNPELEGDKEHYKREKNRQTQLARELVGAGKKLIGGSDENPLTDREWKAIQAGAVTPTFLKTILANADKNRIKQLALPKTKTGMPTAKITRAKTMLKNGYSRREVCQMLDVSEGALLYALEQQGFDL